MLSYQEKAPLRCAIYTRKSTSEGLGQDFNSLDAQREAAEHYIKAMRHDNWQALETRYDDGGFSGGNVERPALQRLKEDIELGLIDCVVVHRVDRLSRSLMDFTQLLGLFEEKGIGFVSTTQQFNTRDAMGRLTLNILLSFAQFEREMIADRTRDKMSAARKKGKWTGGPPCFGYYVDKERKKLCIEPMEGEKVRTIFKLYLDLKSTYKVAKKLREYQWPHPRTRRSTKSAGWTGQYINRLLKNPIYLGKAEYQGELYEGEHEAIIDEETFERVQETISRAPRGRGHGRAQTSKHLLQGLVQCGRCGLTMTPSSTQKKSRKQVFRYYLCRNATDPVEKTCDHPRISAPQIEAIVLERMREYCDETGVNEELSERVQAELPEEKERAQQQLKKLGARRKALQAQGKKLLEAFGADSGDSSLVKDRVAEIDVQLQALEQEDTQLQSHLAALEKLEKQAERTVGVFENFDRAWQGLSIEERRELTQLLVERVEINEPEQKLEIHLHELNEAAA